MIANEPLAIGALSYAGALEIGIAADADALPDVEAFAAGLRDELDALGVPSSAGPLGSHPGVPHGGPLPDVAVPEGART